MRRYTLSLALLLATLLSAAAPAQAASLYVEYGGLLTSTTALDDGATAFTLVLPAGSPLEKTLTEGAALPTLEVAVVEKGKKGGKGTKGGTQPYLIVTLKDCIVSSVRVADDGSVTVVIEAAGYDRQTLDGGL
jgi:hypothetical protein